jgi:hypothetical protein
VDDPQLIAAIVLIGAAGCYLVWRALRSWVWNRGGGCGGGCGCARTADAIPKTTEAFIPSNELQVRNRE